MLLVCCEFFCSLSWLVLVPQRFTTDRSANGSPEISHQPLGTAHRGFSVWYCVAVTLEFPAEWDSLSISACRSQVIWRSHSEAACLSSHLGWVEYLISSLCGWNGVPQRSVNLSIVWWLIGSFCSISYTGLYFSPHCGWRGGINYYKTNPFRYFHF